MRDAVTRVSHRPRRVAPAPSAPQSRAASSILPTIGVAAALFWIAYDDGSYGLSARSALAILLWWMMILGIGLGLWPLAPLRRPAVAVLALLSAYALWTFASLAWTSDREGTVLEFCRVSIFVGVFALVAVSSSPRLLGRWVDGITAAIAAIAVVALVSRLFPDSFPDRGVAAFLPSSVTRLSFPLGYWNGLAIFTALSLPLLLHGAVSWRNPALRGAAIAGFPVVAADIYLASSRGGVAAAAVGIVVLLAATSRRWSTVVALAAGTAGAIAAVLVLGSRNELVNGPLTTGEAAAQGRSGALVLGLVCVGVGAIFAVASSLRLAPPPPRVGWIVTVVAVAVAIVGLGAADPLDRFRQFKQPPQPLTGSGNDFVRAHLLSGNGSGRWQFWTAAADEWRDRPVAGHGAGSYGAWWLEHGSLSYFVRDAHSLYLETLGELGVIGLALLAGALVVGVAAGVGVVRSARDRDARAALAALLALVAAWLVGAGIDWMWELTAVSVAAFIALALLTGPAAAPVVEPARDRRRSPQRFAVGLAVLAVGWIVIACNALPWLASVRLAASQAAVERGDAKAASAEALAARNLVPWAASPYLQLALVAEQTGARDAARTWIAGATKRSPRDWRLWLVAARIDTKRGAIVAARRDLERARRLNPRSPVFAGAGR